ncbi:PAS domain-containing protein [Verrucomicrobia bacterium S94]|nr:PAS domain-containing protein [Verrucomicrobia bacterium S94]
MLTTTTILVLILITNIAVSLAILLTNSQRTQNRYFTFFSTIMSVWILFVMGIIHSNDALSALHFIKGASVAGTWIPPSFHLLCLSISNPNVSLKEQLLRARFPLILAFSTSILCLSHLFITKVSLMPVGSVPDATYGPGFALYTAYYPVHFTFTIITFFRALKKARGVQRVELQFVLTSIAMAIPVYLLIHMAAVLLESSQPQQYGPISIIPINLVIAYGIATRHILEVGTFIRRIIAYILQGIYLIFVYLLTYYLVLKGFSHLISDTDLPAQICATVVVAFSMAPMHGRFQKVAYKLVSSQSLNAPITMKKAGEIFQSITTQDALLCQFTDLLTESLKAQSVRLLIKTGGDFTEATSKGRVKVTLPPALVATLESTKDPISEDKLTRSRQTPTTKEVLRDLRTLNSQLATGVFSQSELRAVILFGSRTGGRIYDKTEQDTLQILCNQFAVALENARLYTAMQDSKIQNEIMLEQLASGVVVARPDRGITLFNNEAQKITGINEEQSIGKHITVLPREIYLALEVTLENENGVRNIDATIYPDENSEDFPKYIRMSSAFLLGHDGKPMGALLVITDITELKALEEQVRRSDQLSSVGTLAAGMAHEIKNPLVTIKTFTQLLPQRYNDEDFRKDFSSLVAHEVERIDGIVNELLSFSKPAKPHLIAMDIQETLDQILKLVHEQLSQNSIKLQNNCKADKSYIMGDAKLLSQAIINLILNAIDAIGENGTLTIGTINCAYRFATGDSPDRAVTRKCIRIQITDNGKGIARENLQKIFDPFFTSKSEGTGMGLSVAHGIISEHHGVIEVDSELGKGTTFYLYMPLLEEEVTS